MKEKESKELLERGASLASDGRYDEALEAYNKAIELDPKDAFAWFYKGFTLRDLKRNDEALEAYNKSIELDPKDASTWNNKGNTLGDLKM